MTNCNCVIEVLLEKGFSIHNVDAKMAIKKKGKPSPSLTNLKTVYKKVTRNFNPKNYNTHEWLSGCEKQCGLFCLCCLLFSKEKKKFNSVGGFNDLNNLSSCLLRHQKSQNHIEMCVMLLWFGLSRIDLQIDKQKSVFIQKHNESVTKNLITLKKIIAFSMSAGLPRTSVTRTR